MLRSSKDITHGCSDGHCGKTTAFKRTQTLKCVLYVAVEQG